MYSKTVMEHFAHPRNVGCIESPDGFARVSSSVHNDLVDIYLRIEDGRIVEVRHQTLGCVAAIAASSMTCVMVEGRTLDDAVALTDSMVVDALGGLPEGKVQCSVMAPRAVREAIEGYLRERDAE